MNTIDTTHYNYWDLVQQFIQANRLKHVSEGIQSGKPVNREQVKQFDQVIIDISREIGAELYSQQVKKQSYEYAVPKLLDILFRLFRLESLDTMGFLNYVASK